ncbi:MAG: hypothetical protein NTW29_01430 [Bacteroidetes bacterium]|nr:hypothetical protein [Bacteroidota bacterium]
MQIRIEKWASKYPWRFAGITTVVLFALFLLLSCPLLNSGDDAYLMYTLSGGYGEKPSALLHYNFGWHPVLGSLVSELFNTYPGINWYSIVLLVFHIMGCTFLLYVLLKRCKWMVALLTYTLLFALIETRLLLTFGFTGAAFTAAWGGATLVIHQLQSRPGKYANIIAGSVLLILAGLLRMQVAWLVILLSGAVSITLLPRRQFLYWISVNAVLVVLLWGFQKQQVQYYKRHISGWEKQEQFRQSLFYSYNRQLVNEIPPGVFRDSTEQAFFFSAFLYDTAAFSTTRINTISKQITRTRSIFNPDDRAGLYWFFVEMRVYLLVVGTFILLLLANGKKGAFLRWLLALLAYIAIHCYLFVYMKMTLPLHFGLLLFLLFALLFQLSKEDRLFTQRRVMSYGSLLLMGLSLAWISVRLNKENKSNKEKYRQFRCAMREVKQLKDKLLVATDDSFPLGYFYIWDTPTDYPVTNLLYKDRLITFTYYKTLEQFQIKDLKAALINDKRVLLIGRKLPALEKWAGDSVRLTGPLSGYNCLQIWQLKKTY